jgi:hypothetical protein
MPTWVLRSTAVRTTAVSPKADAAADALHALLVQRAEQREGCAEGSAEELELAAIAVAAEAYETIRWPAGKVRGGKA